MTGMPTRTALYRYYDAAEVLLYAGITDNPSRRMREHARRKPWYGQVQHQSITWYGSEPLARKAEDRAIKAERPRYNIAGALEPPRPAWTFSRRTWTLAAATWGVLAIALMALSWLVRPITPVADVADLGAVVLMALMTLGSYTPLPLLAYRFGCWAYRNFSDPEMEVGR
jgi:predicted GIY-YIG superfamily endonuclease